MTEFIGSRRLRKIDLIDLIKIIDIITLIKTIEKIVEIEKIDSLTLVDKIIQIDKIHPDDPGLVNGGFETGDFTGWEHSASGVDITTDYAHTGLYCCHMDLYLAYIKQSLPNIPVSAIKTFELYELGDEWGTDYRIYVGYSDGTKTTIYHENISQAWTRVNILSYLDPTKIAVYIKIERENHNLWIDDISLIGDQTVINRVDRIVSMPSDLDIRDLTASDVITVNNLLNPHPVSLASNPSTWQTGTVTHFNKTATGDVKTPNTGEALKVNGFFFYSTADITVELRFKTTGNVIGGLVAKGVCGMNLHGEMKKPQGATDEIIEIYLSGAGTVKGWISTDNV